MRHFPAESSDLTSEYKGGAQFERRRIRREECFEKDNNINSMKMKIPLFKERNNIDTYLQWEQKVELICKCHNFSEEKKVKLIVVEFTNYALVWWDQLLIFSYRNYERLIEMWVEMKVITHKIFVPTYCYRELY